MNARLAEIARNLRRRGSPAVAVALQAVVDVASPEVHLPREQSERLPDTAEAEVEVGARVEPSAIVPRVPVVPSRSLRVVPKKRVGIEPASRANPVNRRSGNARIDARAKRRVPANQASARANELRGARPRMRPKKKKTPGNFRNRSLGGNKLERTLRLRAVGSLRWTEKK
ncbi:hypothetical protein Salat_2514400 [Sesamum alatum]|uniref:Uncharacterized protein n=1 Tax=Sesamum alatum TaxID=300844 RepID=A0AAE1XRU5_9LAMI|nr:hypothetical protein Salat_2514400 [Sesamum alatum]